MPEFLIDAVYRCRFCKDHFVIQRGQTESEFTEDLWAMTQMGMKPVRHPTLSELQPFVVHQCLSSGGMHGIADLLGGRITERSARESEPTSPDPG